MTQKEKDDIAKLIEECIDKLREHVDNVQIFCNTYDEGTISWNNGLGNWHARANQVRDWLRADDERDRVHIRQQEEEED